MDINKVVKCVCVIDILDAVPTRYGESGAAVGSSGSREVRPPHGESPAVSPRLGLDEVQSCQFSQSLSPVMPVQPIMKSNHAISANHEAILCQLTFEGFALRNVVIQSVSHGCSGPAQLSDWISDQTRAAHSPAKSSLV